MRPFDFAKAQLLPPLPRRPRPVVFIGAGGIVRTAQLPAYLAAGIAVRGLFDLDRERAHETAIAGGVGRVFDALADAAGEQGVVFDLAVPADQIISVLRRLPDRAAVLIQKPMGRDLREARRILALCRAKRLIAAVNFQLRFAPNMLALARAAQRGVFGEITDFEVRVSTFTPWAQWTFLRGIPRLEILYHSIHYLDLVRSIFGEPRRVMSWVGAHPRVAGYADTRSATILDFGVNPRVVLSLNHNHVFGPRHAASEVRLEGTRGAAVATMGVNLDYPQGVPDTLSVSGEDGGWRDVPLRGSWFIEAFAGPMIGLQRKLWRAGLNLPTEVGDAARTMALVEACYRAAAFRRPRST